MSDHAAATAVITGATAGIGAAFARRLAADGYALVLVARDGERLAELAVELSACHGVPVTPWQADLATMAGCDQVAELLSDPQRSIDLLVNNAGRGLGEPFMRSSLDDEELLLNLNVRAVLRLTHAALGPMLQRGAGSILNVSSVAAYAGLLRGSTYAASKAWVTTFTESVSQTVRDRGVRVMALCPGFTRTEFHRRAGIDSTWIPGWLWLDADAVAAEGLRDLRRGRIVSVPDWRYKSAVLALRHTPRPLLAWAARRSSRRLNHE